MNYGFTFANNRYASYPINFRMDIDLKQPQLMHMVNFIGGDFLMQPIRFKKDQLNEMTLCYLRSVLK